MVKSVAIIGSGVSGLTAIKSCLEEGFDVTCFEMLEDIGGLWRYREEAIPGVSSLARSTVINSSKEMSAFSDFPPPPEFPNYMHNTKMLKYLELYAERFRLRECVRFGHEVIEVQKASDYESTGRWKVTVRQLRNNKESQLIFDAVAVCNGHLATPNIPKFEGEFKGRIIHTHSYKKPTSYDGQRVLVVGIGNSGVDAAVEISHVAQKVYLSTRRGCWLLGRVGPGGLPFDAYTIRRHFHTLASLLPERAVDAYYKRVINQSFRHGIYKLRPRHRVRAQHPTINDILPDKILTGTITIKSDVHHFTKEGVSFVGEEGQTYPIDTVILATGYMVHFPFISKDILEVKENRCELYKHTFPVQLAHPTLAFIGLIQPSGALIPIAEIQSRWFAQLLTNRVSLPDPGTMVKDLETERTRYSFLPGARHALEADYLSYLDDVAKQFGVKPDMTRLLFSDPKLFLSCFTGPVLPYQYRLQGPGTWDGARDAIFGYRQRVLSAFNTCATNNVRKKTQVRSGWAQAAVFAVLFFWLMITTI